MIKGIHHILMKCGTAEELAKVREFYIELLEGMYAELPEKKAKKAR